MYTSLLSTKMGITHITRVSVYAKVLLRASRRNKYCQATIVGVGYSSYLGFDSAIDSTSISSWSYAPFELEAGCDS